MPEDVAGDSAPRAARVLPPEALASLRDAFAGEVEDRLPRLLALLDGPPGPDALRDAHALGSSAVVVGEAEASRTARALEAALGQEVPDRDRCAELVRELAGRLSVDPRRPALVIGSPHVARRRSRSVGSPT